MHKPIKTVVLSLLSMIFLAATAISFPVFATDSSHVTETVFFGNVKDDGSACGVFTILNTVVDIMSIGIGILAIIGITIVGIKYLTAGGNEEQTRKAKHRMLQIVIGLVVYAALYAGIQFLLPGGKLDFSYRCATISDEELAQIKAEEAEKRAEEAQRQKSTGGSSSDPGSDSSSGSSSSSSGNSNAAKRNKISEVGVALAWSSTSKPYKKKATAAFNKAMNEIKSNKGESGCRKKGKACGMFVGTVIRYSGVDKNMPTMASRIYDYVRGKGKYKNKGGNKKWQEVKNKKQAQPGDIALKIKNGEGKHVAMYVKNSKGKTVTAEASLCDYYGVIKGKKQYTTSSNYKVYRYVGG